MTPMVGYDFQRSFDVERSEDWRSVVYIEGAKLIDRIDISWTTCFGAGLVETSTNKKESRVTSRPSQVTCRRGWFGLSRNCRSPNLASL